MLDHVVVHRDFHLHGYATLDQAPADPFESLDQRIAVGEAKGRRLEAAIRSTAHVVATSAQRMQPNRYCFRSFDMALNSASLSASPSCSISISANFALMTVI